jgi:Transposase IS4
MSDSRRVVGGSVFAKAEAVSKDCKRIYGALLGSTWLKGTVLEVISRRSEHAKRSSTYIKAKFMVGNTEKVTVLSLQTLKDKDPSVVAVVVPPEVTTQPTVEDGDPPALTEQPVVTDVNEDQDAEEEEQDAEEEEHLWPVADGDEEADEEVIDSIRIPRMPESTNHGRSWFEGVTDVEVNGPVPRRSWRFEDQYSGDIFTVGCDLNEKNRKYTPFQFFMACFPETQLAAMLKMTDANLVAAGKDKTSRGELLKWFGVTILITRFEFGSRASLWSSHTASKYIPAINLGKAGMSRCRYDELLQHVRWSSQADERPESMSHEEWRWTAVDDFVTRFNLHRKSYYTPSYIICVDESMSRWYGLGGHWINMGLPQYVAMDRKPEDGCEIQNCCDGKSNIMMQLRLVKSAMFEAHNNRTNNGDPDSMGATDMANGQVHCAFSFVTLSVTNNYSCRLPLPGSFMAAMSFTTW